MPGSTVARRSLGDRLDNALERGLCSCVTGNVGSDSLATVDVARFVRSGRSQADSSRVGARRRSGRRGIIVQGPPEADSENVAREEFTETCKAALHPVRHGSLRGLGWTQRTEHDSIDEGQTDVDRNARDDCPELARPRRGVPSRRDRQSE